MCEANPECPEESREALQNFREHAAADQESFMLAATLIAHIACLAKCVGLAHQMNYFELKSVFVFCFILSLVSSSQLGEYRACRIFKCRREECKKSSHNRT